MSSVPPTLNAASENTPASPSVPLTTDNTVQEKHYITGSKLGVLLGSLTLVTFLVLLDTAIIGTAIPRLTTEFHSLQDVGWYIGAYTLAAATLQPLSGKLYSNFNLKIIFLSFVFVFEAGSLICGIAPSSVAFIVGRAIAGLGSSGIVNGAMTILSAAVPIEKSPMYTGALLGVSQMGIVSGPLVGGSLTEHATWRWCFYLNLPCGGVAALVLLLVHIPEHTVKSPFSLALVRKVIPDLDLFGFALFVPASIMVLLALQFGSGNTYNWNSATVIGLFCGGGVAAILFIIWERRMGDRAMIPGTMLRQRIVWTSCVYGMLVVSIMITTSSWFPTYFQAIKGEGPTLSGVHTLPSILSQLLFVIGTGAAVSKLGYYLPWALFGAIITAVGNGLLSTLTASSSTGAWIGYQVVAGAGRGCALQMGLIAVQNAVTSAQIPVAIALLIFFQNVATAISVVISNTIFAQSLSSTVPRYAPSVSSEQALDAGSGAAAVRALVSGAHQNELDGLLRAYAESLRNIFYFLVGLAGVAVIGSLGIGWKDVSKKKDKQVITVRDEEEGEKNSLRA